MRPLCDQSVKDCGHFQARHNQSWRAEIVSNSGEAKVKLADNAGAMAGFVAYFAAIAAR